MARRSNDTGVVIIHLNPLDIALLERVFRRSLYWVITRPVKDQKTVQRDMKNVSKLAKKFGLLIPPVESRTC